MEKKGRITRSSWTAKSNDLKENTACENERSTAIEILVFHFYAQRFSLLAKCTSFENDSLNEMKCVIMFSEILPFFIFYYPHTGKGFGMRNQFPISALQ